MTLLLHNLLNLYLVAASVIHYVFSWNTVLVILFFGGSIFVHELGHFIAARRCGLRVEKFSIGFGPAIWAWKARDGVEYRISWIPLGGYVLLPQLADLGALEGKSESDPARLPAVGYLQKMLVFFAGPACNVLFAFALATVLWIGGQPQRSDLSTNRIGYVLPRLDLPDGSQVPSPASVAGLRPGDAVVAIDGRPVKDWTDLNQLLVMSTGRDENGRPRSVFTIDRNGRRQDVVVFPRLASEDGIRMVGISADTDLVVDLVAPGSPADKAGFKVGDLLVSLDGDAIRNQQPFVDLLESNPGKPLAAVVLRDGKSLALNVPADRGKDASELGLNVFPRVQTIHLSPLVQVGQQVSMTLQTLSSLLNRHSDVGLSKVAGPIGIVHFFGEAAESGIATLLMFAIMLNVNLAIFNILPIPVLDGGHMLFATIGRIRGKALPLNFIVTTQSVFIALLMTMILYVSVFDVRRWDREVKADRAAAVAKP